MAQAHTLEGRSPPVTTIPSWLPCEHPGGESPSFCSCYMLTNHRNANLHCSLRDHQYIIVRCRNRPREAIRF